LTGFPNIYNNKRRIVKLKTKIVICIKCGEKFDINNHAPVKGNICPSCKIYLKNKKVTIKNLIKIKKNSYCLNCGKNITSKKFCSHKCDMEFRKKAWFKYIKEKNGFGISAKRLKDYIIITQGHKCSICNLKEWCGKSIPLVLDHINGRAYDNRLENLRLVCGNCDMQLPTYKSKNKNSDRKLVRKREIKKYKEKFWKTERDTEA
jgi:hypothetical protein